MKKSFYALLAIVALTSSCAQLEEGLFGGLFRSTKSTDDTVVYQLYIDTTAVKNALGTSLMQIHVEPRSSNTIGKEGGTFTITASYPATLPSGEENTRVLNDFLFEKVNFDAPYVQYKGRERVNDRTVRYTFHFEENDTGKDREPVAAAITDTTSYPKGFGWFSIKQTAE
ncbi:MAG: hypothetical protein IJQ69_02285 [Bacteroidales bacterium]|nr:hypothetical protein [Bacteroidales bacterium]